MKQRILTLLALTALALPASAQTLPTALTALPTPATGDLLSIYDIDEAGTVKMKKTTFGEFKTALELQPLDADLTALAGISGVAGDIIYHNGTSWVRLAKGTAGQALEMNAGATAPEWGDNWNVADPGADSLVYWNDTTNAVETSTLGTGLSIIADVLTLDSDLVAFASETAPTGVVVGTTDTQTLTNKTLTTADNVLPAEIVVAASDETTAITTTGVKVTFRVPYAMTVTAVRASLTTASSSGTPTIDILEGGVSILSTLITIDATEKTSTTAVTAAVISDASLADDAEITVNLTVTGTNPAGLKVALIGTK